MADNAFLNVQNLGHTFEGNIEALRSVEMTLRPGEFLSIAGPSGCGKSTLLRLVAGLIVPTSGTLSHATAETATRSRDTAFVFQQPALLPWRSVEGNVAVPLELDGFPPAERRAICAEVLELVGLTSFAKALPRQLSGGMRMRVSVARALATQPRLLLLDEPFGALDEITRQRLNEELLRLWQRDQFAAIFVTHNVFEAVFLSQRVLVMSARPGTFTADIAVPFDYPRTSALRADPAFTRLAGEVSRALEEAHA